MSVQIRVSFDHAHELETVRQALSGLKPRVKQPKAQTGAHLRAYIKFPDKAFDKSGHLPYNGTDDELMPIEIEYPIP